MDTNEEMNNDNGPTTENYQSDDYGAPQQQDYGAPPPYEQQQQPTDEAPPEAEFGGMPTAEVGSTSTIQEPTQDTSKTEPVPAGYWGERKKRIITLSLFLMWLCVFAFPRWAEYNEFAGAGSEGNEFVNAYKLHVAGAFFIFVGLFFILTVVWFEERMKFFENKWVRFGFGVFFLLGGFLYWVGGIQLAKSLNDLGKQVTATDKYQLSGWAGAAFIESTFVALLVIALDVDVVYDYLSKSVRIRTYLVFNTILSFVSLVAFFSYAAWRAFGVTKSAGTTGCVAAGWFFVFVACMYWYTVEFAEICCRCSPAAQEQAKTSRVKIAGIVLLIWGAFLVMVGMWSMSTTSDKKWNCYYTGYGFFVFYFCIFMALDFHLGQVIEERRGK